MSSETRDSTKHDGNASATHDEIQSVYVPIVYGTMAWWLGRTGTASDKQHSHKWKAFVRGADGRDISYAVRAVLFKLHPSFVNPDREVTESPFELNETGWGEFDMTFKIFFHDPAMKPISRKHTLRLYLPGGKISQTEPVVAESYDEIVFNDISQLPHEVGAQLLAGPQQLEKKGEDDEYHQEFSPEEDLYTLASAHAFVKAETERLRERLARAEAEAAAFTVDITHFGGSATDYLQDAGMLQLSNQVTDSLARQEAG